MQALHRETLESTFDTLERTYGSFDAFLHKGLGLTDRDLERLRSRLLEN
jgi:protein-tyrosine phosphatase